MYQKKKTTTRVPIVVRVADRKIPGNTFQTVYRITAGDGNVLPWHWCTCLLALYIAPLPFSPIKHYIIMLQIKKINNIILYCFL